jgi:hypothetical protein
MPRGIFHAPADSSRLRRGASGLHTVGVADDAMRATTIAIQTARPFARPRRAERDARTGLLRDVAEGELVTLLTAPVIYSLVVPFVLLDLWVSLYQAVCFRAWRLRRARRRDFFAIDRHRLAYLNGLEKINCLYCSYANGVIAYVREIAARTEQYWCPIRHARRVRGAHDRYEHFAHYGDARGYRSRGGALRAALRDVVRR